jgi:hypothetical protein
MIESVEALRGRHQGARAALVCPGTSLEEMSDLAAALAEYDLRIVVNEAIFAVAEATDYLTCFDVKAARKTVTAWSPRTPVVCHQFPSVEIRRYGRPNPLFVIPDTLELTKARAGSLGEALGFALLLGVATLDLYGVDLSRPPTHHYAKTVMRRRGNFQIHESNLAPAENGRLVPDHFRRFAREIELHKQEWESMQITNRNPWSLLDTFPKRRVDTPPREP